MPKLELSSVFDAPVDRVWEEAITSRLLLYVTRGRIVFTPIDPPDFPEVWQEGEYKVAMKGFGFIPLGWQIIGIETPSLNDGRRAIRDNGRGQLFAKWDHWIFLEDLGDGRTRYTDEVDYEAGVLNAVSKPFIRDFYAHRQKRWQRLIASGFAY